MNPDNKRLFSKQIAFLYGIAISIIICIAGVSIMAVATESVLRSYQEMIEVKERCTNETYLSENQYKPGAAEAEIGLYENSYNVTYDRALKLIVGGTGLMVLAVLIAYVPINLYVENGKALFQDPGPKKR